jgi:hypothetical protein
MNRWTPAVSALATCLAILGSLIIGVSTFHPGQGWMALALTLTPIATREILEARANIIQYGWEWDIDDKQSGWLYWYILQIAAIVIIDGIICGCIYTVPIGWIVTLNLLAAVLLAEMILAIIDATDRAS